MTKRDAVMWLVMLAMIAGLHELHNLHLIRTNFNMFLAVVLLMSAAVTAVTWVVRPKD